MASGLTIKSIIICAIGGQGGNLLAEWIFLASQLAGLRAQSISMPGLAQRGGATTYYLEVAIADDPQVLKRAVFSTNPFPGEVDILVAQEYLEMGRMLQRGFGAPDRTAVVASTHRDLTVFEKMAIGEGVVDTSNLENLARAFAQTFIGLDVPGLIRQHGLNELSANAVLLGALAATNALPITVEQFAEAIRGVGVAAEGNLKAFQAGLTAAQTPGHPAVIGEAVRPDLVETRTAQLAPKQRAAYRQLAASLVKTFGPSLGETLIEATYQLTDFQDTQYAAEYVVQVEKMGQFEQKLTGTPPGKLTQTFARNLATLMTYEDAVRVADFKTRADRFARIKKQLGVKAEQPYKVVDYLKPDMEQIYGIFPTWVADPFLRLFGKYTLDREGKPRYWGQTPNTTSFAGYMTFVFLTWFKPWRRQSWRYRKESQFWAEYQQYVREFATIDYELGDLIAMVGQMVRGYGEVREKTFHMVRRYLDHVIRPVMNLPGERESGYRLTRRVAEVTRKVVLADDNGIDLAEHLAQRVQERYASMPYEQLIDEVEKSGNVLKQNVPVSMRKVAL